MTETLFHLISGLSSNFPYLLRMMAADTIQSQALVSVVERLGWTRMAILTSNTDYGKILFSSARECVSCIFYLHMGC